MEETVFSFDLRHNAIDFIREVALIEAGKKGFPKLPLTNPRSKKLL